MSNNVFPDPMNVNISSPSPLPVDTGAATTAFGEMSVAQLTPLIQITAQHGVRDNVVEANLGGTTTEVDSNFVISTGTGASNVGALVSTAQASYKAGQGLLCRYSCIMGAPQANSTQLSGFLNSACGFGFGYNGLDFGIVYGRGGALEYQELTLTTGASASENATITIDGNAYTVPLTNSSIEQNAYEIAESLTSQVPGYGFTSIGPDVECLAQLPDFGGGAFAFSSATAVGAFVQIEAGKLPIETWINKADWNVNPDIDVNPQLGNVYQVQLQYLGYGGIRFYIENQETSRFELVHIFKYANTSTIPLVRNPTFRVGWAVRNTGNTTDVSLRGASASAFIEGERAFTGGNTGLGIIQPSISTNLTNLLTIRCTPVFNNSANRNSIILSSISMTTESTKVSYVRLIKNPTVTSGFIAYEKASDLGEVAINQAGIDINSGKTIGVFSITSGEVTTATLDAANPLNPGDVICFAGQMSSGANSDMSVTISWQDDF